MTSNPHIAILMATWNGAKFVSEQLDSFTNQIHQNWSLWVSDDGSSDNTQNLILDFKKRQPDKQIKLVNGPKNGLVRNFMSLLAYPDEHVDMVAFADQGDVWLPTKLQRSIARLPNQTDTPALYGARTIIADAHKNTTGMSPLFTREPSFGNALVQSLAGGNTMLINRPALDLIRTAGLDIDVVAHDWWMYQLISGAGGTVYYDVQPTLLYRQHAGNAIGSNANYRAQLNRINGVLRNRFRDWNSQNIAALKSCQHLLSPENRTLLSKFEKARMLKGFKAIREIENIGIYRQTNNGTKSLKLAAALGKI